MALGYGQTNNELIIKEYYIFHAIDTFYAARYLSEVKLLFNGNISCYLKSMQKNQVINSIEEKFSLNCYQVCCKILLSFG